MKKAIVTGSSSGIGREISKKLLSCGYEVYGLARDMSKAGINNENFHPICIDLTIENDFPKLDNVCVLVNAAGVGYFSPHEELSVSQIKQMVDLNLLAPLLVTNFYLRELKKNSGHIFNINSISAIQPALYGAVYGATKAGLKHFSTSLFKEARKSGLKVININPDITKTNFFDNLHFKESDDELSFIKPEDIAKIIEDVLNTRDGTVITDITIEPQKFQIKKKKIEKS